MDSCIVSKQLGREWHEGRVELCVRHLSECVWEQPMLLLKLKEVTAEEGNSSPCALRERKEGQLVRGCSRRVVYSEVAVDAGWRLEWCCT